jgi:hypothetical protein
MASCAQRFVLTMAVPASVACVTYQPPAPAAPREATQVAASFGQTWDAVIDEFADRNIPIRTIERASGLVATEQLTVSADESGDADCGHFDSRPPLEPTHAIYNVLVRGDSVKSTIKVTMRWMHVAEKTSVECSTRHKWERAFEETARLRAERNTVARGFQAPMVPTVRGMDTARYSARAESADARKPQSRSSATVLTNIPLSCEGLASGQLPEPQDELRRLYVADLRRAGIVKCVEQLPPDLVRIMVGPNFSTIEPETREQRLGRLYGMYGSWGRIYMELWTESGKFGEYVDGQYRPFTEARTPGGSRTQDH